MDVEKKQLNVRPRQLNCVIQTLSNQVTRAQWREEDDLLTRLDIDGEFFDLNNASESVLVLQCIRRVLASAEFEAADNGAQGQLQFLHGEAHADAVARTQAERRVRVRIQFVFVLRRPSVAQQRAIAVGKAVHAVQIPSKNLHLPGGIERFRPIVVLFGEMKRINGNTHNHSLLDVDSIEGQVLIALALQSIEREKNRLRQVHHQTMTVDSLTWVLANTFAKPRG